MLCNQPTRWWAPKTRSEPLGAIGSLDFDAERSQNIDTPTGPRRSVRLIAGHRSRDFGVDQPMSTFDIMVVTSRSYTLNEESFDGLDLRKRND